MRQNAGQIMRGTKHKEMQEWYDGYRFGRADIYCLDVINYVNLMRTEPDAEPRAFLAQHQRE